MESQRLITFCEIDTLSLPYKQSHRLDLGNTHHTDSHYSKLMLMKNEQLTNSKIKSQTPCIILPPLKWKDLFFLLLHWSKLNLASGEITSTFFLLQGSRWQMPSVLLAFPWILLSAPSGYQARRLSPVLCLGGRVEWMTQRFTVLSHLLRSDESTTYTSFAFCFLLASFYCPYAEQYHLWFRVLQVSLVLWIPPGLPTSHYFLQAFAKCFRELPNISLEC